MDSVHKGPYNYDVKNVLWLYDVKNNYVFNNKLMKINVNLLNAPVMFIHVGEHDVI